MSKDQIHIELVKDGQCPQRMTKGAVGYDVFIREIEMIGTNSAKLKLGFKIDTTAMFPIPDDDIGLATILMPRSGWGAKNNFRMLNTIGLIDMDYRGEVMMFCEWGTIPSELQKGARAGQLIIMPVIMTSMQVVDSLSTTERGEGGFGSTGHE